MINNFSSKALSTETVMMQQPCVTLWKPDVSELRSFCGPFICGTSPRHILDHIPPLKGKGTTVQDTGKATMKLGVVKASLYSALPA